MPSCSNAQKLFQGVPSGSTVHVWTTGLASDYNIFVDIMGPDPSKDQQFQHQALANNAPPVAPGSFALAANSFYFVRFTANFLTVGNTRATIHLRVVRPDGTQHSSPISCWISGRQSDGASSELFAVRTV